MSGVNYISNGKWYIEKHSDICEVYDLLDKFYSEVLVPMYGESKSCRIVYDMDLQIVKIKSYGKHALFTKDSNIVFTRYKSDFMKKLKLLFDSIVAMGIVNAPFCFVDIYFKTGVENKDNLRKGCLTTSSAMGKNNGYFMLKGKIY